AYQEAIADVEARIGEIFWLARSRGRPFVLVVTSDHGELFGEHGGFAHSGGFVPELLDIPFIIYDSRRDVASRRCQLMLGSEAVRTVATEIAFGEPVSYPDHDVLMLNTPPLGSASIERSTST